MSKLEAIKFAAMKGSGPLMRIAHKHGPKILMGLGIGGVVASGALLVQRTLQVEPLVNDHKIRLDEAKDAPKEEKDRAVAKAYFNTSKKMLVHYGPAVSVGMLGLTSILISNGILARRNAALVAAYQTVSTAFGEYRKRVEKEVGEDRERELYLNLHREEVTDPDTKEVRTVVSPDKDPNKIGTYARFFDELNPFYSAHPEHNLLFLKQQQSYLTDMLRAKGHVFLNEVYTAIGIPKTQAGNVVGWSINEEGDDFIDFGIYDFSSQKARDFVNGYEKAILLDFNVNGAILQTLPKGL